MVRFLSVQKVANFNISQHPKLIMSGINFNDNLKVLDHCELLSVSRRMRRHSMGPCFRGHPYLGWP